jgi:ribosomal protein S18 acetylase RimI-like enzyme
MSSVKEILVESFQENKSVQDVVKQDSRKEERLKVLIDYSIFMGENFGKIYLNKEKTASAIIINSKKKKSTFSSLFWNIKLAFSVIGFSNAIRVLKRANLISNFYPDTEYIYLWFIGVKTSDQGKGAGTELLAEIIKDSGSRPIYLETSTVRNFPFYEKYGFKRVINFKRLVGYDLHMYRYQAK